MAMDGFDSHLEEYLDRGGEARLEGAEEIPALIRRFPGMELATDEPAWNGRIILRGLDTLHVTLTS